MTTTAASFHYLATAGTAINRINAATLSQSGTEDSNFPLSNLQQLFGDRIFRYSAAGADDTITADLGSALAVTFCSVHFHNLDSGITVEFRRSTDNFAANDVLVATLTKNDPTFFATFASVSFRYYRLKFVGTNSSAIYIGKWGLGAHKTLTRMQRPGWGKALLMPQARGARGIRVNQSLWAARALDLPFLNYTEAQHDEVLDMLRDSKWGEEPTICVPDSEENIALYARVPNAFDIARSIGGSDNGLYDYSLEIEEDPFPIVTK